MRGIPGRGGPARDDAAGDGSAPHGTAPDGTDASAPTSPRATETRLAVLLGLLLAAYFAFQFVASLLSALGVVDAPGSGVGDPVYGGVVSSAEDVEHASGYSAVVLGLGLLAGLPVTTGLWFRRSWARDATYLVFGLTGLLVTLITLSGVLSDDNRAGNAVWGVAVGVTLLTITGLVASPGCGADFARVARDRDRGLAARRAANARRRTGST